MEGVTKEGTLREVRELATNNEMVYHGCSQSVLAALQEKFKIFDRSLLMGASVLGGGIARHGDVCGALLGALLSIGAIVGRERLEDDSQYQKAMNLGMRVYERFVKEVGCSRCADIQKMNHGRSFDLTNPEERKAFHKAGSHEPENCPAVCGKAAEIAADFIISLRGNGD